MQGLDEGSLIVSLFSSHLEGLRGVVRSATSGFKADKTSDNGCTLIGSSVEGVDVVIDMIEEGKGCQRKVLVDGRLAERLLMAFETLNLLYVVLGGG